MHDEDVVVVEPNDLRDARVVPINRLSLPHVGQMAHFKNGDRECAAALIMHTGFYRYDSYDPSGVWEIRCVRIVVPTFSSNMGFVWGQLASDSTGSSNAYGLPRPQRWVEHRPIPTKDDNKGDSIHLIEDCPWTAEL